MKLKRKTILICTIILSIFTLLGCKVNNKNDNYEISAPESILMGDSSLEGFFIVEGSKKTQITKDMLQDGTEMSFYKEGSQTFTISYNNTTKSVMVNVVKRTFTDFVFVDTTLKYTGEVYKFEVSGVLPADVYVFYPYGNEFQDVGEYEVTAVLSAPYYVTQEIKAKLTIVE